MSEVRLAAEYEVHREYVTISRKVTDEDDKILNEQTLHYTKLGDALQALDEMKKYDHMLFEAIKYRQNPRSMVALKPGLQEFKDDKTSYTIKIRGRILTVGLDYPSQYANEVFCINGGDK